MRIPGASTSAIRGFAGGVAVSVVMASSAVAGTVPANEFGSDLRNADELLSSIRQSMSEAPKPEEMPSTSKKIVEYISMMSTAKSTSTEGLEISDRPQISVVPLPAAGWLLLGGLGGLAALRRRKG